MKTKTTLLSITLAVMVQIAHAQQFEWAKKVGGNDDEYTYSIASDASGNVYTTGAFKGTVDFDPGAGTANLTSVGDYDIFIFKLDASGNFLWAKQLGGTNSDWGIDITIDASGNVYSTGVFEGTADFDPGAPTYNLVSTGGRNLFVSKLDASGNFVWAKQSRGIAQGSAIKTDGAGNVFTAGNFEGTTDFDPGAGTANLTTAGGRDGFIFKWDAMGNFVWAKQLGGALDDVADDLTFDGLGNVLSVGYFSGTVDFDPGAGTHSLTAVAGDIFISKLDASGNFVWAKKLGGTDLDWGYSISTDASGNVYTTGYFQKNADFDPGAGAFLLTAAGLSDVFISKLDASGNFVWAKQLGGKGGYSWGKSITTDASGNLFTTGSFEGTADFNPGADSVKFTSNGNADVFISKLDASGQFVWAKQLGGTMYDETNTIMIDGSGNVYTTGNFRSTVDFDPGQGTFNLTSAGGGDGFICKLAGTTTGLSKQLMEHELLLYPNPTKGQFQMVFNKELSNVQVTVRNMVGQEVDTKHYSSAQTIPFNLGGEAGLYFIEISSQGEKAMYKILKE